MPEPSYGRFARYVLIVFAIGLALLVAWYAAEVLLLGFGGILFAVAIRAGGEGLARHLPLSARWCSVLVVLLVALALFALGAVTGDEVARQFTDLRERLPDAVARARATLQESELGRGFLSLLAGAGDEAVSVGSALQAATLTFGVLADLFVVALVAIYLGLSPRTYLDSTVALAPVAHQDDVRSGLVECGAALKRWLLGQLVSMTFVGVLTGIGLWLIGVPNAVLLGVVTGLFVFVPILGPIVAAVPGILLALAVSPTLALYAAGVYFLVQQIEGALITPMAQRWAVDLPPALGVIAIVLFGALFGFPGVLFATPLTVVIMVLVRRFYLEPRTPPAVEDEAA